MRVRGRWPLRILGMAVFGVAAAAPWSIAPSPRTVMPLVAVDPEVERVARYLEWRAPASIDPILRRQISSAVVEESRRVGFDPLYILAVMEVESDFVPEAVSNADARGLLQLRQVTVDEILKHETLPAKSAHEPEVVVNVRLGVRYLAMMERRFVDRVQALAAWNAGPGAVKKALAETGELPERWIGFARSVEREHRRIRRRLAAEPGATVAQASVPGLAAE